MATIGRRCFLLILCSLCGPAWAGSLTASLDKNQGSTSDQFVYTLTADGEDIGEAPPFPKIDGLTVQEAGTSHNYSIINGVSTSQWQGNYIIEASREGVFEIPSLTMKLDGKNESTLPLRIVVTKAAEGAGTDALVFVERIPDIKTAYVGQPITLTTKIYTRVQLSQPRATVDQQDAFSKIEIKGEKNFRQVRGSFEYDVIELAEIIIPNKAGTFDVPVFHLNTVIPDPNERAPRDPFGMFGPRGIRKNFASKHESLTVMELPKLGRPIDFSGLVGQFQMTSQLSTQTLQQGDTATLTIKVEGKGRVNGMADPAMKLPPEIKVYPDKPEETEVPDRASGLRGRRVFKYALVPNRAGTIILGKVNVWFFNTASRQYESMTNDLGELRVSVNPNAPSSQNQTSAANDAHKEDVKVVGEDIIGLHRSEASLNPLRTSALDRQLQCGLLGGSAFFCAAGFVVSRRRSSKEVRTKLRRTTKAYKTYASNTKVLRGGSPGVDVTRAAQALEIGFKNFLGDKLTIESNALTTADMTKKLLDLGLPESIVGQAQEVLNDFDRLNYGGGGADATSLGNWLAKLDTVVDEVEKRC